MSQIAKTAQFRTGQVVTWVGKSGRRYTGHVLSFANSRAAQVRSREGFKWLLPLSELQTLCGPKGAPLYVA